MIYRIVSSLALVGVVATTLPAQSMATVASTVPSVQAQTQSPPASVLARAVTVDVNGMALETALRAIEQNAGVHIVFSPQVIPAARKVTVSAHSKTVAAVLADVLRDTRVMHTLSPRGQILLIPESAAARHTGIITGRVIHAKTKQPVSGVTVLLGEATKGVTTGEDGTFRIPAATGEHRITVRAVGFTRQVKTVTVQTDQTAVVEVILEPGASVLDEVIVTGTMVATQRREIATPITVITAEDIARRGITRIDELFRGEIPGVYAAETGIAAYAPKMGAMTESRVYARGSADMQGGANPLKTYVDGIEIAEGNYLGTIDPQTIERIEIITGPQAASIYGSGAMGGVMQIFTKRGSGVTAQRVTLRASYGALQSSVSQGRTPTHNDGISLEGGRASLLTYAATVSYNYSGEWQPGLYSRSLGASLGTSIVQDKFTVNAQINTTYGSNGTSADATAPVVARNVVTGEWRANGRVLSQSKKRSVFSRQGVSVTVDHRIRPIWRHSATVGIDYTSFGLLPQAPSFMEVRDTIFSSEEQLASRSTGSYVMELQPHASRYLSSNISLGGNYTVGQRISWQSVSVTGGAASGYGERQSNETSWGYFGQWRFGILNSMYWTLGVRAELNPAYGLKHKIDWVPANGLAYNFNVGEFSVKLLASYGRATRVVGGDQNMERTALTCPDGCEPARVVTHVMNPYLTPEYSRGPQGGVEVYYGNWGSLALNHYQQRVDNLVQFLTIDSTEILYYGESYGWFEGQYQFQNTSSIRQKGWEGTGSVQLGPASIRGSYSWTDSRVESVNPASSIANVIVPGAVFPGTVSHTGSISVGFAHGKTNLMLVSNWVGARAGGEVYGGESIIPSNIAGPYYEYQYARLRMYRNAAWGDIASRLTRGGMPGYWRSDLSSSRQISPSLTITGNIKNVMNSYTSNTDYLNPTLGRVSTIGVSYRWK